MSNSNTISERVQAAAESYLTRKGFEILETGYRCDLTDGSMAFVAREADTGEIVFVDVAHSRMGDADEGSFNGPSLKRWQAELLAGCWLAANDVPSNTMIRFDAVSIMVVGDSRAVLRHHRGAYGLPEA